MTTGYAAVTYEGDVLVDTVSSTARAAMVNWLVIHGMMMILNSDTDGHIASLFYGKAQVPKIARILKVAITVPE